ncbi:hypothetical protein KEM54_001796, partial [Ascosphaera aggregata]
SANQDAANFNGYWIESIKRQGAPFQNPNFKIFRNVKDYGAKGDGVSDDTEAINAAVSDGNRCGLGCGSSTTTPAIVYFPAGTYAVSKPINQLYMTQFIGDVTNLPVLKAMAKFQGMAVIDSDPYNDDGSNWYINQNNFYRQVRNFVIDLTALGQGQGAGIHWQVGQATSLQNIRFEMVQGGGAANKQQGIFMDNGSGGFMSDLTFNGGGTGAFLGAQQFTLRNVTFNNCQTAVFMNWNWVFSFKSMEFNGCGVGINMTNGGSNQTVGSVLLLDSKFTDTKQGVVTVFGDESQPEGAGSLILQNVDLSGAAQGVVQANGQELVKGGGIVESYIQGNTYTPGDGAPPTASKKPLLKYREAEPDTSCVCEPEPLPEHEVEPVPMTTITVSLPQATPPSSVTSSLATGTTTPATVPTSYREQTCTSIPTLASARVSETQAAASIPTALLMGDNKVAERSRPQYEEVPVTSFISVKSKGAKGDGETDDTVAFQNAIDGLEDGQILYVDHGLYVLKDTIKIPKNIKVTGEIWPVLLANGEKFSDQKNPRPLLQVGQPGDTGNVELTDLVVGTKGPAPGAVLIEWNVAGEKPGDAGMWDVHTRIGGYAGSDLQSDTCPKTPESETDPDPKCTSGFAMLRVTETGSGYFENNWYWVSDHELDRDDHAQINIYTGRGVLVEGNAEDKGNWFIGTASEHSTLYNYQVSGAKNVYMTVIQTETPYFQSNPTALVPYTPGAADDGGIQQVRKQHLLLRRTDDDDEDDDDDEVYDVASESHMEEEEERNMHIAGWNDPAFGDCRTAKCKKAWGARVINSEEVYIFGAGLYSFFENYGQQCLQSGDCQINMLELDCNGSGGGGNGGAADGIGDDAEHGATTPAPLPLVLSTPGGDSHSGGRRALVSRTDFEMEEKSADSSGNMNVWIYALSTKASVNMVTIGGKGVVPAKGNKSTFCHTVGLVKAD